MSESSVVLPRDGSRPGTPWWIRGTSFVAVDSGETYDEGAVLRLQEELAVAVEAWRPVTPIMNAAALTPREGRGFDAAAVNRWLGMVQAAMNEGAAAQTPAPVVQRTPAPSGDPAAAAAAPAASAIEPDDADVAQRINDARFTALRFRMGYVMADVDDFLDVLVATVTAGQPIAELAREVVFPQSRVKEAYPIDEVDAFLVEIVRANEGVTIARTPPTSG